MKRRRFLMIAAGIAFAKQGHANVTQWRTDALGGTVQVDLRGPKPLAQETIRAIAAIIEEIEIAVSLFRPDSALSRLNAEGRFDTPPRALADLAELSTLVHDMTEGVFDPTVQPLWKALASGEATDEARQRIGWAKVSIDNAITLAPGQALTFNGIAQGYAADRVRGVLAQAGYGPALIDMGEFAALGGPFRLGVEDPLLGLFDRREITNAAIATSSPAAMRLGEAYHILGPHGEIPMWSTISVTASSAAMADGLSTAFCLMKPEAIRAVMARATGVTVTAVSLDGDVLTL